MLKIKFVLDRSGSMNSIKQATIDGYNGFIAEQRQKSEPAESSLYQFDDVYEVHYEDVPLLEVPELSERTFIPRNTTALNDALVTTILLTAETWLELEDKPEVLIILQTDGYENASKMYTVEQACDMCVHAQLAWGWKFLYIGANQCAGKVAATYGIGEENAVNYSATEKGVAEMFATVSAKVSNMR
jgi:hypothetical protein